MTILQKIENLTCHECPSPTDNCCIVMRIMSSLVSIDYTNSLFIFFFQLCYEDSMDLIAKLPTVAAIIYRNLYKGGSPPEPISKKKDWSWNYTTMLGFDNPEFVELMRLYLTIHA